MENDFHVKNKTNKHLKCLILLIIFYYSIILIMVIYLISLFSYINFKTA